jgi:acetyltransferase-like isoleucine patch superfamily enzyme
MRSDIGAAPSGSLKIGDRVFTNQGVALVAYSEIEISDDTMIGELSAVYDCTHHAVNEEHPTKYARCGLEPTYG